MTRKQKMQIRRWRYYNWGLIMTLVALGAFYITIMILVLSTLGDASGRN